MSRSTPSGCVPTDDDVTGNESKISQPVRQLMDSSDVQRIVDEQQPDPAAQCPYCGKPVRENANIWLEDGVLNAHCGGSGLNYIGEGCFRRVAWDPVEGAWVEYD